MDCNATNWRNNAVAIAYMVHGVLYLPLYVPCLMVMLRPPLINESCYKLMAFMGFIDLAALAFSAFIHFSSSDVSNGNTPVRSGGFPRGQGLWGMYAFMCIVLATSRVMGMRSKTRANSYFGGMKAWYWCAASGLYFVLFTGLLCTPQFTTAYHSRLGILVFDPIEAPGNQNLKQMSYVNTAINFTFGFVLTVLYVIVLVELRRLTRLSTGLVLCSASHGSRLTRLKKEQSVTIQSVIICLFACVSAYGYVIIHRVTDNQLVFVVCQMLWQMTHGINGLVYLSMNVTIRRQVLELFRLQPIEASV